jgi:glycosyltransferase involved in cell wall biosynthesis
MLVSHRFPPDDIGGLERYTESLAAELTRCGDSVSIFARRWTAAPDENRLVRERLPDGTLLYRMLAGPYRPSGVPERPRELDRLFMMAALEAAPQVVHVNHLMGMPPGLIQIAHRMGAAVVISLHDFYFACPRVHLQKPDGELCTGPKMGAECAATCFADHPERGPIYWALRTMYFRRALEMAERVIAYSRCVASYFRSVAPITVIENGIPAEHLGQRELSPSPNRNGRLTLAYCGTVAPHKGPHLILEALSAAGLEGVRLLLIGHTHDRAYGAKLREKAAAIPGLQLQFYGSFSRNELPLLLGTADCVIVPSLAPEAGPIAPREALAAGVPVVASRRGALPELIVEGQNGLIFDAARPSELTEILRRISRDPELLPRLRAGARNSPVTTVAEHAQRVREVFQSAIEDFSRGSREAPDTTEFDFLQQALQEWGAMEHGPEKVRAHQAGVS